MDFAFVAKQTSLYNFIKNGRPIIRVRRIFLLQMALLQANFSKKKTGNLSIFYLFMNFAFVGKQTSQYNFIINGEIKVRRIFLLKMALLQSNFSKNKTGNISILL